MKNELKKGRLTGRLSAVTPVRWMKLLATGATIVMTGCTSLGVGNSEYACPGMPDGVQCMSTRDVYAATNDGNVPRPLVKGDRAQESGKGEEEILAWTGGSDPEADFINTYVAPQLPNRPVPIRTPAQVMRIWIAPWEDTNGDLITTGYVHTEIEPRRWVIADEAPSSDPVLQPLQVTR